MDANTFLTAVLEATEQYEVDPRRDRWDGGFMLLTNANGLKPALLGSARSERIRVALIDDLVDAGMLRSLSVDQSSIERKFSITSEGRRRARELAASAAGQPDAVDLSWPTLRARLSAFVADYERAGAPMHALPLDNSSGAAIHLRTLVATGYLEETVFGSDQQTLLQPTERALAVTRSWPSAVTLAREVVNDVVAELEHRPEQDASTMRASLTASGRDLLVEVLASVIAKQSGIG